MPKLGIHLQLRLLDVAGTSNEPGLPSDTTASPRRMALMVQIALHDGSAAAEHRELEFVELAVLPSHQGRGIGGQLHDTLLAGLPHQRALLATADDATTAAVHLYTKRGWQRLGKQSPSEQVMGKIL